MHALIVGAKHVGKSTLIKKVVDELGLKVSGFETKKEDGLTDESRGTPVYIYAAGKPHVRTNDNLAAYCGNGHPEVFAGAFDRAACLPDYGGAGDITLMDELGFMESSSEAFCSAVLKRLDCEKPVIAAVKDKSTPFLDAVKNRPDCRCFFITAENRDELFPVVLQFVRRQVEDAKVTLRR